MDLHTCSYKDCGEMFASNRELKNHTVKVHNFSDFFVCSYCSKSLSTKQSLKEHINTHTHETPYKCPYPGCGEAFKQTSKLSNHKKLHEVAEKAREQQQAIPKKIAYGSELDFFPFRTLPQLDCSNPLDPFPLPPFNFTPYS